MTDSSEALRRDVNALGRLLGETLVEQEGRPLYDTVEALRALAKARRTSPTRESRLAADERFAERVRALAPADLTRVTRAFAHYFQLVNLAEQHHRVRRLRARALTREPGPGAFTSVLPPLASRVDRARADALLQRASVELVFTAHPTEAQRRTVLDKHRRIARILARRDREGRTPDERDEDDAALRDEVTTLWQTDELREEKLRVGDEVKNVLFYLEEVLFPLVPRVYEALERVVDRTWPGESPAVDDGADRVTPLLRFGSWVGADMDGNPNVTPSVAVDTALAHAQRAAGLLLGELSRLGEFLSQSQRIVPADDALLASIARDHDAMGPLVSSVEPRTRDEPYRRKLRWIEARLTATRERFTAAREELASRPRDAWVPPPVDPRARTAEAHHGALPYERSDELVADLRTLERSLARNRGARAGLSRVRAVRRQTEVFGLHLATLDVRVPAEWVRDAARAALWIPPEAPLAVETLREALTAKRVPARPDAPGMRAMEALASMRSLATERAGESFILSMARGRDDLLAALVLARIAGLYQPEKARAALSVVPLFETLDDLTRCAHELDEAAKDPAYARYLALRGGTQEVMLGYSDSNKDAGLLAASFALYRTQQELLAVGAARGITLKIFHGRGGSIGRGGGPAQRAIEALPRGSIDGRFKLTEQGEVLGWKYLLPEIAERNLEQTVGSVLRASLVHADPPEEKLAQYEGALARACERSLACYRALVSHPRFVEYYTRSTPLDEIGLLHLGSRPARRTGALTLADLRAIPWVFAWTQSRQGVPGWFGAGAALSQLVRERGLPFVREMYSEWAFFTATLDAIEVALAVSDMGVARRYAALARDRDVASDPAHGDDPSRLFLRVLLDHERAVRAVRAIRGGALLAENATLARSIELRNPYVDPMSFIQLELLRRKRAHLARSEPVPAELQRAILLTLNGIAAGLRTTG